MSRIPATTDQVPIALSAASIRKTYGATTALHSVDMQVKRGEIHGLLGANGAGKSTLVKILSGAERADSGEISVGIWSGSALTPRRAQKLGLATIYQEPTLCSNLTIADNIVLGRERAAVGIFLPFDHERKAVSSVLERVGIGVSPLTPVGQLSPASRQLVEIAKALYRGAEVIIMDEPTAVLGASEVSRLLTVVKALARDGVAIIYISHHLQETLEIADRVTVMRDGYSVLTSDARDQTTESIVEAMIGRDVTQSQPSAPTDGKVVLSVKGLGQQNRLSDVTFDVRAGEVVGITGLMGSGRSRLAKVLFGAQRFDRGEVMLNDRPYAPRAPIDAIRRGVGLVSEDRKTESLLIDLSISKNISMVKMPSATVPGFISLRREVNIARRWVRELGVRPPLPSARTSSLSGGNQQKVAIARWLHAGAELMIFDEPGQGVDIGAKEEILQIIGRLAAEGCAVIVVSSDFEELVQIANRVIVMRLGRIVGELAAEDVTERNVLELALGAAEKQSSRESERDNVHY